MPRQKSITIIEAAEFSPERPFLPPLAATRREEVFSMTEKEKRTIRDMRAAGRQDKEISAELGIEVSALKVL